MEVLVITAFFYGIVLVAAALAAALVVRAMRGDERYLRKAEQTPSHT